MFGDVPVTPLSVTGVGDSDNWTITVVSPSNLPAADAGTTVAVQVFTEYGMTSPPTTDPNADQFTYLGANPTVSGVSPSAGPTSGGTTLTITGTNLSGYGRGFYGPGGVTATGTIVPGSNTDGSITVTTRSVPTAEAGTWNVVVDTPYGRMPKSAADQFIYTPAVSLPSVTGISPAVGAVGGGTTVTIMGANLSGAMAVDFGGVAAASYAVNPDASITAVSPAGSAGTVDVTVTTGGRRSHRLHLR